MTSESSLILEQLGIVTGERQRRARDPGLEARVREVKAYQHRRFARSYDDLLSTQRYAQAARFFLDDLYGPHDFSDRDDQFARIVPALVRLFPNEIVSTVRALAELHGVTEVLDTQMAQVCPSGDLTAVLYLGAWQATGCIADRERQIALMLAVGSALDRYTRNPVLRHSLRLMRAPARAAGMAALQSFLERGFDTFREMRGAQEFLATIAQRERALAACLFDPSVASRATALGQLP